MNFQSMIVVTKRVEEKSILEYILSNIVIPEYSYRFLDSDKNSIGIKDLENIIQSISLKKDRVEIIVIKDSYKLTHEAQNSLLKTLEEPFSNTLLVLHTKIKDRILDTILSRCLIFEEDIEVLDNDPDHIEYLFRDFAVNDYLSRDKSIEDFLLEDRSREDVKRAINEILKSIKKSGKEFDINVVLSAYKSIDYNVSPKLVLDYLSFNV